MSAPGLLAVLVLTSGQGVGRRGCQPVLTSDRNRRATTVALLTQRTALRKFSNG
jgi:hypothetical protein